MLATGAKVTAIGTGGRRYGKAFVEDEAVQYPVLLDERGTAADIVGTQSIGATTILRPSQIAAGLRSFSAGHRQRNAGRRPTQLGATVVIGPGDLILYEDFEDFAGDHADLDQVIDAIIAASRR